MWTLRRVSNPLRNRGLSIRASASAFSDPELPITCKHDHGGVVKDPELGSESHFSLVGFYRGKHTCSSNLFVVRRGLSSQVGAKDGGEEDDFEDGFSQEGNEDDYYDCDESSSDTEVGSVAKGPSRRKLGSALANSMIMTGGESVHGTLDRWVREGNKLGRTEITSAMTSLRKLRMYGRALQFSDWLVASNKLEFAEKEYASHLDLIAKVQGLFMAEKYMAKIPESFRGELVYRTLLANCVLRCNTKKAEEVFNKMRDLKFSLTTFVCNQLLLLYKRIDKKKVADVILLMENENLKPNVFTYKLLIDVKGKYKDIQGIEALLETMKAEGIEQDLQVKSIVARHYISAGVKEKAEAVLKEIEEVYLPENRLSYRVLLEHYAELGQVEEVSRIWSLLEEKAPSGPEFVAAVGAWGKLKDLKKSEAIFEEMLRAVKRPTSLHYNALLTVYADNKMLEKGKDLVRRMSESGIKVGPLSLDSLLRLYVEAGLAEKADEILMKAARENHPKPLMYRSYLGVMEWYADRGDIHNTEKIFRRMREAGYTARLNQFQTLVRAYVNAKHPAYGMRERMMADNLFPNKALAVELAKVDSLKKSSVSYLLD